MDLDMGPHEFVIPFPMHFGKRLMMMVMMILLSLLKGRGYPLKDNLNSSIGWSHYKFN